MARMPLGSQIRLSEMMFLQFAIFGMWVMATAIAVLFLFFRDKTHLTPNP